MAAILCKPIGSFFELVCTAPCKLCSGGCKSLCTNPLSAYVVVTFLTQIPVVVAGAMELGGLRLGNGGGCKGSEWLLGMLLVALAHMATAVYLSYRVTNGTDEALRDRHTSWERISYLLCHDPWIAFYILVYVFFFAWLCVGSAWSIQGIMDDSGSDNNNNNNNYNNSESNCGYDVEDRVSIALGFGWFFLFCGPTVLSCNLCCVCCDKNDYAADDAAFEQKAAAKAAAAQANRNKNKRNSSYNNNNNDNNNNAEDIETPNPPPQSQSQSQSRSQSQSQPEPKMKTNQPEPPPPRTYSADGIPISNSKDRNSNDAIPAEAVAEEILPPAMMPPKAEVIVDSVTKTVGGWFSGGSKKKSGDPKAPDVKATVY